MAPTETTEPLTDIPCRDALLPLLTKQNPDRERLLLVQRLCESQAAAGDVDALYQLSLLHLGLLDWDPEQAIPMIRTAAEGGVAEAQYWLAWQYEEGPLLENDAETALYWYVRAGDLEHRLAVQRLLDIYTDGGLGQLPDAGKATLYRARLAKCMNRQAGLTSPDNSLSDRLLNDPSVSSSGPNPD